MMLGDIEEKEVATSRKKIIENTVVGYAERHSSLTGSNTDVDTDSDFESGLQMKLDNATNKKERKKISKALTKQQKTAEKQRPYKGGDRHEQPLTSTVIASLGREVGNRRGEAFGNS